MESDPSASLDGRTHISNVSNDSQSYYDHDAQQLIVTVITSSLLGIVTLCTVIGNVFVIAAILLERNLRTIGNYLVLSLAIADLMVACLVMPFGAIYWVSGQVWNLGAGLCDVWTMIDVLCCTASILHLLAIAIDRYWAVTNVDYIHNRNARRIGIMIITIWTVACVVSLAPALGWKDDEFLVRIEQHKECLPSQEATYQIFATLASFYVPLILILILYWRIYQVARKRIRHKPGNKVVLALRKTSGSTRSLTVPSANELTTTNFSSEVSTSSPHASPDKGTANNNSVTDKDSAKVEILPQKKSHHHYQKESLESKRERKAAKTLAIITGLFVICWLPFFVFALLLPLCESCRATVPKIVMVIFLWLGYINSCFNPVIYTIFSPDFRAAFKRMLFGKSTLRTSPKGPVRV